MKVGSDKSTRVGLRVLWQACPDALPFEAWMQYEEAVKAFQPYDQVKEPNPQVRVVGKVLIAEGNAPETNDVMLADTD